MAMLRLFSIMFAFQERTWCWGKGEDLKSFRADLVLAGFIIGRPGLEPTDVEVCAASVIANEPCH